jgi:putative PEP-CTERM system integral membrane protein
LADDAPKGQVLSPEAPVWMVHLGGHLAPGYDDATLAAIQKSGGGVASSVAEALNRFAAFERVASVEESFSDVVSYEDGVLWTVEPTTRQATAQTGNPDAGFSVLAARQAILHKTRKAQLGKLEVLDGLHAIAVHYGIVSPYSSMLVLVNDQQRELLKHASTEQDRFSREVESGKESLGSPDNPLHVSDAHVSGTPEPQEWLLLALAAGVLLLSRSRLLKKELN